MACFYIYRVIYYSIVHSMCLVSQEKKARNKKSEDTSMSKSKSIDFINGKIVRSPSSVLLCTTFSLLVGITIDKPTTPQEEVARPMIPIIQTSSAVDGVPSATSHDDSSSFLNGPSTSSNLLVKPTMTKAKSMVWYINMTQ